MNADHPRFADWDAAFVLGALSPSDRRLFEAHLQECALCRDAIVETAPTIALLARVTPDRAESLLDPEAAGDVPAASRRSELIAAGVGEAQRRRRIRWAAGLSAAAAVVIAAVIAVTLALVPGPRDGRVIALEPLTDVPVTASVELVDVAWGTRMEMTCRYAEAEDPADAEKSWAYALFVTSADGTTSELSSWVAFPGATARIGAGTALSSDEITAIEIRSLGSGRVLMRTELDEQPEP